MTQSSRLVWRVVQQKLPRVNLIFDNVLKRGRT